MTISADAGRIRLAGRLAREDAEPLLALMLDMPVAAVDWTGCEFAHSAVIQVLLASRRTMLGLPASDFLRAWIAPALSANEDASAL